MLQKNLFANIIYFYLNLIYLSGHITKYILHNKLIQGSQLEIMISITKIINWKQQTGSLPLFLAYKKSQNSQDDQEIKVEDISATDSDIHVIQGYAIAGKNTNTLYLNCEIDLQSLKKMGQGYGDLKIHLTIGERCFYKFKISLSQLYQQKTQYFVFDENSKILQVDFFDQNSQQIKIDVSKCINTESGISISKQTSKSSIQKKAKTNQELMTSCSISSPAKRSFYEPTQDLTSKEGTQISSKSKSDLFCNSRIQMNSKSISELSKTERVQKPNAMKIISIFQQILDKQAYAMKNAGKFASKNALNIKTLKIFSNEQDSIFQNKVKKTLTYRSVIR